MKTDFDWVCYIFFVTQVYNTYQNRWGQMTCKSRNKELVLCGESIKIMFKVLIGALVSNKFCYLFIRDALYLHEFNYWQAATIFIASFTK